MRQTINWSDATMSFSHGVALQKGVKNCYMIIVDAKLDKLLKIWYIHTHILHILHRKRPASL